MKNAENGNVPLCFAVAIIVYICTFSAIQIIVERIGIRTVNPMPLFVCALGVLLLAILWSIYLARSANHEHRFLKRLVATVIWALAAGIWTSTFFLCLIGGL